MSPTYPTQADTAPALRRGFSLLELLVVIAIVFLIITLVVPFLGGAQNIARATQTQSVLKEFGQAVDAFRLDRDQDLPGVFDVVEMNRNENQTLGFTAMENALLELSGGLTYGAQVAGETFNFGPTADARNENMQQMRWAIPSRIGLSTDAKPSYFRPDPRFLERGVAPGELPTFIDGFGTPLLLWVENRQAPSNVTAPNQFALDSSGATGASVARYYRTANSRFLNSQGLGRIGRSQVDTTSEFSLIGGAVGGAMLSERLTGFLGNPAYPNQLADPANTLPTQGRGQMVVHSAGLDGIYFSSGDSGARRIGANAGAGFAYRSNFFPPGATSANQRFTDDSNQPATQDLVTGFDDIIFSIGG